VVYLVRHAHAGNKSRWRGPDRARPLSARGRLQALGLVDQLQDRPIRRVLSSPADRCRQTIDPLARQRGLVIEPSEALAVDALGAQVLELLEDPAMHQAVLCTHGEVIGQVFAQLRAFGAELSDQPHWPKGSTWVLGRDGVRTWSGRYLEPQSAPSPRPGAAKVASEWRGGG
jgi:8-oxo-dGTP diphosphatase